jgi:hypothetical protein
MNWILRILSAKHLNFLSATKEEGMNYSTSSIVIGGGTYGLNNN